MPAPADKAPIGDATMQADGTLVLDLRAQAEGVHGLRRETVSPSQPRYYEWLELIGDLRPGEQRVVPPWPDPPPSLLVVLAELRLLGATNVDCGRAHRATVMSYEVVRVLSGKYADRQLLVAHGCPKLDRHAYRGPAAGALAGFRRGDVHRLVLSPHMRAKPVDIFATRMPRYWAVRVDPADPADLAPASADLLKRVCAAAPCSGGGSRVDVFRSADGSLRVLVVHADVSRCPHGPSVYFDAEGRELARLTNRPVERGSAAERAAQAARDKLTAGLTRAESTTCP